MHKNCGGGSFVPDKKWKTWPFESHSRYLPPGGRGVLTPAPEPEVRGRPARAEPAQARCSDGPPHGAARIALWHDGARCLGQRGFFPQQFSKGCVFLPKRNVAKFWRARSRLRRSRFLQVVFIIFQVWQFLLFTGRGRARGAPAGRSGDRGRATGPSTPLLSCLQRGRMKGRGEE